MTTYTNIAKPIGTQYTNSNPKGFEQYDQSNIMYDDSGIFYDGTNYSMYTNVPKPIDGTDMNAGMTMGLLMPLTRKVTTHIPGWTKVAKPN